MNLEYWSGTGNQFLIGMGPLKGEESISSFAKKMCQGGFGIVCDGLVLLQPNSEKTKNSDFDFVWQFYNKDGSMGEMCGNAARCVVSFLHSKDLFSDEVSVKTESGVFTGQLLESRILVEMSKLEVMQVDMSYPCIDSGVPHVVVETDQAFEVDYDLAKSLRFHKALNSKGANVTFYSNVEAGKINSCTFERGVEAVTQACGTGAVAAAFCSIGQKNTPCEVLVKVPGGDLMVRFDGEKVFLLGETLKHFELNIMEKE